MEFGNRIFGNGTNIVHWKANPQTRGTLNIVTVCITTLLLCIWKAVHLNVSPPGTYWRPKLRKLGWLFLTLLAPEIVAFTAWMQKRDAKSVMHYMKSFSGQPNPPSFFRRASDTLKLWRMKFFSCLRTQEVEALELQPESEGNSSESGKQWTMSHGFYVNMGGLAVNLTAELRKDQLSTNTEDSKGLAFLGPAALPLLTVPGRPGGDQLLALSKEEIESKSKDDSLAKTVVCIQSVWFVMQCFTRLVAHVPISLLEVNTFGHACCAILIYVFWWDKPSDVGYPTVIENDDLLDHYALALMRKYQFTAEGFVKQLHTLIQKTRHRTIGFQTADIIIRDLDNEYSILSIDDKDIEDQASELQEYTQDGLIMLPAGNRLPGTGWRVKSLSEIEFYYKGNPEPTLSVDNFMRRANKIYMPSGEFQRISGDEPSVPKVTLTPRDVARWTRAWKSFLKEKEINSSGPTWESTKKVFLFARRRNFSDFSSSRLKGIKLIVLAAAILAPLIYGGLHALAWSAHFQSSTQQTMWRISVCVVMGGIPAALISFKLGNELFSLRDDKGYDFSILLSFGWFFSISLVFITYILARAYLIVECFINLRYLPPGAYDVPPWTAYFPHFS